MVRLSVVFNIDGEICVEIGQKWRIFIQAQENPKIL